jgi:phage terminase large subunit-like protein
MTVTTDDITRWIRGPADESAAANGCYFDLAAAERVRTFFRRFLRITTREGKIQPFELLGWQWERVIAPLFGWKRADGLRRFTRGYISTAKKNGKTEIVSGLALFLLLADGEPGAEIYSAASDREQAGLIYRAAAKMVDNSAALDSACTCKDSTKTIVGQGRSFYRALSAEAGTKDGPNASAILFDELHAQPDRELWDKLRYAGSARRQPLMLTITTAGSDKETICGEQYEYAKRVQAGEIVDDQFFVCIFEADSKDDWTQEATWHRANPSLGVTITIEQFRADLTEALESPAKENSFRRYRLNQWVQTADAWLSMEQWDKCPRDADAQDLAGRECYAGLDLSATDDTTALELVFPMGDMLQVLSFFWLPEDNIATLEKKHRVSYRAWAKAGHMRLTPGNVVDYAMVRRQIGELAKMYHIKQLSIDRKFQGQSLENDLIADGFDVVPAGQGWVSQDLPAKDLEKRIKAGIIDHGGNPILRWHASNVVVDIDKNNNYTINKRKSRSKIDGIAALLMAIYAYMQGRNKQSKDAAGGSFYERNPDFIMLG